MTMLEREQERYKNATASPEEKIRRELQGQIDDLKHLVEDLQIELRILTAKYEDALMTVRSGEAW